MQRDNDLSRRVIGCAIEVHRTLGPGLLESIYGAALGSELRHAGIAHVRQQKLPVIYKNENLDCDLGLDIVVEQSLILEVSNPSSKSCPCTKPSY
jgi:GxxExxY protein